METKKRLSDDAQPASKRLTLSADGPLTLEDVELFQRDALFRQMETYRRERDELQAQLAALEGPADGAAQQAQELAHKYTEALARAERAASVAVARVHEHGAHTESATPEPAEAAPATAAASSELEAQLRASEERAAGLESEGARLRTQLADADSQRLALSAKLAHAEEQLASAPVAAKAMEARLADAEAQNTKLAQSAGALQAQIDELKSTRAEYEHRARQASEERVEQAERRLAAAESDAKRLRKERDDLHDEVAVLKAENAAKRNEARKLQQQLELELEQAKQELAAGVSDAPNGAPKEASNGAPSGAADGAPDLAGLSDEDVRARCAALARQKQALEGEIGGLESGFRAAKAKAREALRAATESEQKMGVLNTAKVRSDHKYLDAMRMKDAAQGELASAKRALAASTELLSEKRALEAKLVAQAGALQKELAAREQATRARAQELVSARARLAAAEGQLAAARAAQAGLRQQLDALEQAKLQVETAKRAAEQAQARAEGQLAAVRATSGAGAPEEVREQLESLRSIAMCPVCQKNWKNRAVSTCGHAMCAECVQARLAARMRSCPICNTHFASADVLPIHL